MVKITYIFYCIVLLHRVNAYIIIYYLILDILKDHRLHQIAEKLILIEYLLWTRHSRAHYRLIFFKPSKSMR